MSSTTSIVSPFPSTNIQSAPSKGLRWFSGLASALWWSSVALSGLIALVWIAIYVVIVPRIGEFRPQLENRLTAALGVPLRIGEISAQVNGLMPTFTMSQVRLLDAQGRDALVLQTVTAAVSPQSLLDLGFEQLLIEQPELTISRNAQGSITVAGFELSPSNTPEAETSVAADWLFSQGEIVIRSGTLRWIDKMRGAPPLALNHVNLYLRNQGRRHQARLEATPSAIWGSRFVLSADFLGSRFSKKSGDWRSWQGHLHADLPQVDVQQLRQYTQLGVDITQGRGALRGWLALDRGTVRESVVDAALADVNVRLRADLQPVAMKSLSGRFSLLMDESNLALRSEQLAFETRDGLRWLGGNAQLSLKERGNVDQMHGDFSADKLDLAVLAQISDRLPLDASVHSWLRELQPQGVLPEINAKWRGLISSPKQFEVQGHAKSVTLQPSRNTSVEGSKTTVLAWHPGVRNANVDFKFNEKNGSAQLQIENGSISLPGMFEEPTVALDQMSTELSWQIEGGQIQVQIPQAKFANADAKGEAKATWKTADPLKSAAKSRFPGILDLQGSLTRAEGTKVHRYLPIFIAQEARYYVRDAVLEGKLNQGTFRIKGDLYDMPFADPSKGEFRVAAQVTDAVLDYVPRSVLPKDSLPWPALTQINGELIFDRQSMTMRGATARIANAPSLALSKVEAYVADLSKKQQVMISAEARGNAADALNLVNTSPLAEISSKALAQASINGQTELTMRLLLPINELHRSRVQGTVTLPGNDFQIFPQSPTLLQAKGQIFLSEKGFELRDVSARAFGGDIRLDGGSRPARSSSDVSVALRAQGTVTAEGLRQAKELGYLSRLATQANGSAAYVASLNIRRGVPEISVSSNLQGLGLNLPQPLSKPAEASLLLRYDNLLVPESLPEGRNLQDQISLELGSVATANYIRDISGDTPRVIRGRIGVGLLPGEVIAANDNPGVAANINFSQLNVDAWEKLLSNTSAQTARDGTNTGLSAETRAYLPSILSVRARELTVQGRTLNNIVVGGSREDLTWRANLDARELNGYIEYRQASSGNSGRVYARLARLSIAAAAAADIEATLDQQPTSIPALDIVVEDLELRGTRLGRVELEALNRESAGVREWRLSRLNVSLPEAQFSATGNWALVGTHPSAGRNERRRTALNFKLDIANSGDLLKRVGQDKVLAQGKGVMQGQISWLGAPWALDYASMNGGFNLNIENGQFLKADPGLAKLLGVLSLQSLPRRLSLDFRDVFTEGFAFDFLRGDVKIEQGVAFTNNLQMKGINAAVLMEGTANIAKETQNIKVVVVPEINAGTASLVAAVINPAVGLGTFLAQLILRRPLIEAATQEFQITGSWLDPQVKRVKRINASQTEATTPTEGSTKP